MKLCKKLSLNDVLKCSLGLTSRQAEAMKATIKMRENFTVGELAKKLGKDRSTAQRHLAALEKKKVVFRIQRNRDKGGYEYIYTTLNKKELKHVLLKGVDEFTSQVKTIIKKL